MQPGLTARRRLPMLRSMSLQALFADHIQHLTAGYARALQAGRFDGVIVHAGRLERKSPFDDQDWPFRAVPAFEHWAPVMWPDSAVLMRLGQPPKLLAHRNLSFWEKPAEPDFELLGAAFEVVEVNSFDAIKEHLGDGRLAFIGHSPDPALQLGLPEESYNPSSLIEAVHELRTRKTAYEVQCLYEASVRAAQGHQSVGQAFMAGVRNELDLHLTYLMATEQDDAECPYKNIVALGTSGAVLHHITYGEAQSAESLLIDAGARARGYASDITRTHVSPAQAEPVRRFADLVAQMDRLQLSIIDRVEVGQPYEMLHDAAHQLLGELLVNVGLAKVSAEACVQTGLTRLLFPHGLGHSLGIQVHDVGMRRTEPRADNRFLRNTSVIEEGQVFTVEPGLYFIDHLLNEAKVGAHADTLDWDLVDELRPFGGIRIEDNVLVKGRGVRNLTREAFAQVEAE